MARNGWDEPGIEAFREAERQQREWWAANVPPERSGGRKKRCSHHWPSPNRAWPHRISFMDDHACARPAAHPRDFHQCYCGAWLPCSPELETAAMILNADTFPLAARILAAPEAEVKAALILLLGEDQREAEVTKVLDLVRASAQRMTDHPGGQAAGETKKEA